MPQPILDFYQDLLTKNWFAVAALTIMAGTQVLKTLPWLKAKIWAKIPVGYRFLVPVIAGSLAAFVHGFEVHETLYASIWDAVKIIFSSMGAAAALKESPLPWDGGAGGAPLPLKPAARAPALPFPDLHDVDDDKTPVDRKPLPPSEPPPTPPAAA